jgi:hypothetical protein
LFYFELAEQLGMSVSFMLEHMSSKEITEWMAFYNIKREQQEKEMDELEKKAKGKKVK